MLAGKSANVGLSLFELNASYMLEKHASHLLHGSGFL